MHRPRRASDFCASRRMHCAEISRVNERPVTSSRATVGAAHVLSVVKWLYVRVKGSAERCFDPEASAGAVRSEYPPISMLSGRMSVDLSQQHDINAFEWHMTCCIKIGIAFDTPGHQRQAQREAENNIAAGHSTYGCHATHQGSGSMEKKNAMTPNSPAAKRAGEMPFKSVFGSNTARRMDDTPR